MEVFGHNSPKSIDLQHEKKDPLGSPMRCGRCRPSVPIDLHICLSVGEEVTKLLPIHHWETFFDCSIMQSVPPDTFECRRVIKEGKDGLLRLSGLISVTDRLREGQELVFT